jgi:thiol-disulfide isomerase/thioredoxin
MRTVVLAAGAALAVAIVAIFWWPASKPVGTAGAPPLSGEMAKFELTGRQLPPISFAAADGKAVSLKDFAGRVVLLNLWATWCAPCVKEMPTLDRLQAALGGSAFEVVTLSSDRTGIAVVARFLSERKLDRLTPYLDQKGEATRALDVAGLPTTLLIDVEGREIGRLEGPAEWDSPEAKALMRYYINRSGIERRG